MFFIFSKREMKPNFLILYIPIIQQDICLVVVVIITITLPRIKSTNTLGFLGARFDTQCFHRVISFQPLDNHAVIVTVDYNCDCNFGSV